MMDKQIYSSSNGYFYEINEETRTARKVGHKKVKDFTINLEEIPADEQVCKVNTKFLYDFLKKELPEESIKRRNGYLLLRDYKIKYSSHGYQIIDNLNWGKKMNENDYHNDMSRPEDVLNFLTKHVVRERELPEEEKEKRAQIEKLSEKFVVKESQEPAVIVLDEEVVEMTTEDRINLIDQCFQEYQKSEDDVTLEELKINIYSVIESRSLKVSIAKVFRDYLNTDMRFKSFTEEVKRVVREFDSRPNKKKVPKFYGLELIEPMSFKIEENVIKYEYQGPTKRAYAELPVGTFLAKIVLHYFPRTMQLIMKVAADEIEVTMDEFKRGDFIIKDPYCEYHQKTLDECDQNKLYDLCQEILWHYGKQNPLNRVMEGFKNGQKIEVLFMDLHIWKTAQVIDTKYGVKLRYEDGYVDYLYQHQKTRTK
jgi:hypothetical protein